MDYSILYGLKNPAMTDDIGMSMIDRQFPTTISPINQIPADGVRINNGQPNSDVYQTKRQKEYSVIKKALLGLGLAALAVIGYKKGPKYIKQTYQYIKTNTKTLLSKFKNFIKNIF